MERVSPSRTRRLYRLLLRVLPFEFRSDFGRDMEETFSDQAAAAERSEGRMGLVRLWLETLAGIFRIAPGEHWQMLRQDTRYALRMMRKNLGYTAVAVMTLALGVGVNTAIFSVIHGTLLRPLPYVRGDQLVILRQQALKAGISDLTYSVAEVNDYRQQNHTLSGVVEYHHMQFTLFGRGEAERVQTGVVSANFFDLLGVKPILGRTFLPADDQPGAPPVLVLSYEYWRRSFHGDPEIVGKTFEMNDKVHMVVGVLPPVPQYPDENDVYMATSACPFRSRPAFIANRNSRMMRVFGRLKPGVTAGQADADLATIAGRLQQEYPKSYPAEAGYNAIALPLKAELTQQARPTLLVLLAAAGFVLLIACANVANFSLARVAQRERELLVRSALGAGRGRLLRQLLTESVLMGVMAGVAGLLLAGGSLKLLVEFAARLTPRAREISLDGTVLLFALAAAVVTSIVSGSVLAFSPRERLASGLKEWNAQSTLAGRRKRIRNGLIVLQVAFSFVLLIGAGLMVRSLVKLQDVDPGFAPERVLTMGININWSKYTETEQRRAAARRLLEQVQSVPGVVSAAVSSSFPLDPDNVAMYNSMGPMASGFRVEGQPVREGEVPPLGDVRVCSPDYFKTLGIPLLVGRSFALTDNYDAPHVAVINQSLARHRFGVEDPTGKRISFDEGKTWTTIVGVAGDTREFGLDRKPEDEIYLPMEQTPALGSLVVRTFSEPAALVNLIRQAVRNFDSQTALTNIETLEQARSDTLKPPRLTANLLGLFGVLALVIAATGIGGILALSVNQRVHEIGIRLALGARPADVRRMVIGHGMLLVLPGLALGAAGALAVTPPLRALLFQVTPTDPWTFGLVAVVLALTALLACFIPARRATRIDPLTALRHE
jgi:putative ABC transport system permease protein